MYGVQLYTASFEPVGRIHRLSDLSLKLKTNAAGEASFSLPYTETLAGELTLARHVSIHRGTILLFSGRIRERDVSKPEIAISAVGHADLLRQVITPAQWQAWNHRDLAEVVRDLVKPFAFRRWTTQADWQQAVAQSAVDLTTEPGKVMLATRPYLTARQYVQSGYIVLRTELQGALPTGRIVRWSEEVGSKVRITVQTRAGESPTQLDSTPWGPEMTAVHAEDVKENETIGVPVADGGPWVDIRFNLYTDDTTSPDHEDGPTIYGFTPILTGAEIIWRLPAVVQPQSIPASAGVTIQDREYSRANALQILSELCEEYHWQYRVYLSGNRIVLDAGPALGQNRANDVILRHGENAEFTALRDSDEDLVNVLHCFGAGDGPDQLYVVLRDEASIAQYGEYHGDFSDGDMDTVDALRAAGQEELAKRSHPKPVFEAVHAFEAVPPYGVGDSITAADPRTGKAYSVQVEEYEITWSPDHHDVLVSLNAAALDLVGQLASSRRRAATALPRPLRPPSMVRAVADNRGVIVLWSNVRDATGYDVERSDDGGTTWRVVTENAAGLAWADTSVRPGEAPMYRVRSRRGNRRSEPSGAASARGQYTGTDDLAPGAVTTPILADDAVTGPKIASGAVGTTELADAAITAAKIGTAQITAALIAQAAIQEAHIADASITSAKIRDLAVSTADISDAAITQAKIGLAAIATANIQDLAVTAAKIAQAAIDSSKIQSAAITTALIADSAITGAKIQTAAVGTAHIADLSVVTAKIADLAVTDAKIASLTASKLTAGTIDTGTLTLRARLEVRDTAGQVRVVLGDISALSDRTRFGLILAGASGATLIDETGVHTEGILDSAVITQKLADLAVATPKLADSAVVETKVANAAITTAKIATAAITTALIADAAITSAKIQDLAVSTADIADAAIVTAKIGNAQITGAQIASASIETVHIRDGAIDTVKVAIGAITSALIADAAITEAKIQDAAVTNAKIASLDAAKITSGFLDAARIRARSITTDKLVIKDPTNLCPNPQFDGGSSAEWTGTVTAIAASDPSVPAGAPTAYVGKQMDRDAYCGDGFPVRPGERFIVEVLAATLAGASTYNFGIGIQFFRADGSIIGWYGANQIAPTASWTTGRGEIVAPDGAVRGKVWTQINGPHGSTGYWFFTRAVVRRYADRLISGKVVIDGEGLKLLGPSNELNIKLDAVTGDAFYRGRVEASEFLLPVRSA